MTAQKLAAWRAGQLVFESQLKQQEGATAMQQKVEADAAGADNPDGRGVETSEDVMKRGRESISEDGKAPLDTPSN